jgi:AraC family transcriptional regulator
MKIHIKNMVCRRCVMVVSEIFKVVGIEVTNIQIGSLGLVKTINNEQFKQIEQELNKVGFEIINSHTLQIIEQIKTFTINYIYGNESQTENFSSLLAQQMQREYNYLSSLFSSVEGSTIEKYMINLKIERVKELLVYDEKTLSEIAFELRYSSVSHLSGQFKKVTGFTPTYFKKLGEQKRKSIDNV